jgi:hypothetical protein
VVAGTYLPWAVTLTRPNVRAALADCRGSPP